VNKDKADETAENPFAPKRPRPYFFDDPAIDKVLAITMAVAGELAVTRERLDTLERIMQQKGALEPAEIESFSPDAGAEAERSAWRDDYVARILRVIEEELATLDAKD